MMGLSTALRDWLLADARQVALNEAQRMRSAQTRLLDFIAEMKSDESLIITSSQATRSMTITYAGHAFRMSCHVDRPEAHNWQELFLNMLDEFKQAQQNRVPLLQPTTCPYCGADASFKRSDEGEWCESCDYTFEFDA